MNIFLLVILVVVLLLLAVGYVFFFIGVVRFNSKHYPKPSPRLNEFSDIISSGRDWFKAQNTERIEISAYDSTKLVGLYLPADGEPRGTLILFHGYRMDGYTDFSCAYKFYHDLGYSLLNVFQRAHGESGGQYICYGIKERFDCRDWACYVADRFGPEHNIFLGGLSMGSTTVLMATGTALPPNVRGVISDSGFTSPYDEFVHILKDRMHLPVHPIIDIAGMFCKIFAGYGFNDYSTLTALRTNTIPVLFVHGEDDTFVPLKCTIQNYAECTAEKRLITVPGAGHGFSYLLAPQQCQEALKEFLYKYTV